MRILVPNFCSRVSSRAVMGSIFAVGYKSVDGWSYERSKHFRRIRRSDWISRSRSVGEERVKGKKWYWMMGRGKCFVSVKEDFLIASPVKAEESGDEISSGAEFGYLL